MRDGVRRSIRHGTIGSDYRYSETFIALTTTAGTKESVPKGGPLYDERNSRLRLLEYVKDQVI
jgi:hypothetical protein